MSYVKYGNIRTAYNGEVYDSKGEAEYARRLDLLQAAGQILEWRRGTEWVLLKSPTDRKRDGITLRPDFEVYDTDGALRVIDFKGMQTDVFRLKAKLWRAAYPQVPLYIVTSNGREERIA